MASSRTFISTARSITDLLCRLVVRSQYCLLHGGHTVLSVSQNSTRDLNEISSPVYSDASQYSFRDVKLYCRLDTYEISITRREPRSHAPLLTLSTLGNLKIKLEAPEQVRVTWRNI